MKLSVVQNLSSVIKMSTRSVRTIIKNINEDICGIAKNKSSLVIWSFN